MTFPVPPAKGQPVRAELIRQIIDCLRMFRPLSGQNIRTQTTPGGTIINGTPGGGGSATGTAPWTIRKHITEDDTDGQWEIWLPTGCMSVGSTLTPLNRAASEVSGHAGDKQGWYVLALDEEEGAADTSTEGEGESQVTTTSRTWDIVAHAKTSAKVDGVDELSAPARRLLYVSARKRLTQQEQADQTAVQRVKNTWGDEFSQVVATVTIGSRTEGAQGEGKGFRKISQTISTPISVQGRVAANFDLVWYFKVDEDDVPLAVSHVYCVRPDLAAAGMGLSGPEMTEVTGAQNSIYAKVITNPLDLSAQNSAVELVLDPTGMVPDNYVTWLHLYSVTDNAVTADLRQQALSNVQVYR